MAERFGVGQQSPAVSIIVPCYNGGRFLDGLMASLACQTLRDFEVVIVDDGSTDTDTLHKLATLEWPARVIRQDNSGPSAARNRGIRAARADVVFMLDCDDTIEPTFLEETVAALRAAPADVGMVFTDQRLVGTESGLLPRYFHRFDLLFTNTMASGLVMSKASWQAAGGYDETMRDGYEDWDFSLRLAYAGYRGIRVPKPLYIYYIRGDDAANSRSSNVHAKRMYGRLWKLIRERHAPSYRLPALLRLWWTTRDGQSHVPLYKGLAAYALALVLPDAWFSALIGLRRRRLPAEPEMSSPCLPGGAPCQPILLRRK
jgi:glycosyltransferase involved in cell wall biosynthesis